MKQGEENSGYPEQDVRAAILQPDSPADRRCSLAFSADPSPESLVRAGHWKRGRPLAECSLRWSSATRSAPLRLSTVARCLVDGTDLPSKSQTWWPSSRLV